MINKISRILEKTVMKGQTSLYVKQKKVFLNIQSLDLKKQNNSKNKQTKNQK